MGKNKALFGDLASNLAEAGPSAPDRQDRSVGHLLDRTNQLADIVSGSAVEKTLFWVDPAQCRMWPQHNRRYDRLDERNCADLIEGFRTQGQQEFPAIVRRTPDDESYDFEVICGARRHWTVTWLRANNYPQFKFLVEERELTDEEAFRLSDVENRDRLDISDYERALDYQGALERYYGGKQKSMAARLQVSETWLSRYLDVARLPKAIVLAYADIADIKASHARDLKPLLKARGSKQQVLAAAETLAKRQAQAREGGAAPLDGRKVLVALIAATKVKPKKTKSDSKEYQSKGGSTMLAVNRHRSRGLLLQVLPNSGASKEEILEACQCALDDFFP